VIFIARYIILMTRQNRIDEDMLYAALIARDPGYEGIVVGVHTTGVFCRLTCAARKPLRKNVNFYHSADAAIAAGFRACKRCKPLDAVEEADAVVVALLAAIAAAPDHRWVELDLARYGIDASTARRAFTRRFGQTFLQIARQRRLAFAAEALRNGEAVITAQVDAGYAPGRGFRTAMTRAYGNTPRALRDANPIEHETEDKDDRSKSKS
jgi:AraC family transcriptional regulator of adaptative response/methylated-DNA-[protein]-cysteine methyltransferase